jgi:hypothetical protein
METENTYKIMKKFCCELCHYTTSRITDYTKHISTNKHKTIVLEQNVSNLETKKYTDYVCEKCNYSTTVSRDYNKHLHTKKHLENEAGKTKDINRCNCGKIFIHRSGLWKHRQKCSNQPIVAEINEQSTNIVNSDTKDTITNNIPMNLILEVIKQSKEIQNVLVEQNKELQAKLLEQSQQLLEQNKQIIERSDEHHKQIIELAKKPSMVNSNNQFNLNFFLNETCKNAMNIQDFIQSIKLTTQDFENTGRLGFVDGISRIFINELKRLEVERRPLHCTDMKRETVYVKDNDTWEKENQEKKKLKWAINSIAQLNLNQVQEWQQEYPECRENNTVANTRFNEMAMVALGGFGDEQETKFRDKIMKNVLREIVVGKEM